MFTEKGQLVSSSAKSLHTSVKHISRMIWEHINCFCRRRPPRRGAVRRSAAIPSAQLVHMHAVQVRRPGSRPHLRESPLSPAPPRGGRRPASSPGPAVPPVPSSPHQPLCLSAASAGLETPPGMGTPPLPRQPGTALHNPFYNKFFCYAQPESPLT